MRSRATELPGIRYPVVQGVQVFGLLNDVPGRAGLIECMAAECRFAESSVTAAAA
jgi:hypothetical protein